MKHIDLKSRAQRLLVAGTFLISSVALASLPGLTWADSASSQTTATQAAKSSTAAGVDGLISHLHQALKITPAQESQFQKLADVMRENAETMSAQAKKRADNAKTISAVDDLKSYAEISEEHAQGTKKMIPAFQALYDSMSDDQKKAADEEFREHYAGHHHHK